MSQWFAAAVFGKFFVTLLVIMDPPGVIPVFLGLTQTRTPAQRRRMAGQAVLTAFVVIVLFAVFGGAVLRYLGITLPALQGAGGLLLLLVALDLLMGKHEAPTSGNDAVNLALVPLGTPLLAGPAAIVATIVAVRTTDGTRADLIAIGAAIVAVHLILWITLRFSGGIVRVLKDSGVTLISRVAGLLLAAIAVQLVADSVRGFITQG